jgi:hypothetical protein
VFILSLTRHYIQDISQSLGQTAYIQGVKLVKVEMQVRLGIVMCKCAYWSCKYKTNSDDENDDDDNNYSGFFISNYRRAESTVQWPMRETAKLTHRNNAAKLSGRV